MILSFERDQSEDFVPLLITDLCFSHVLLQEELSALQLSEEELNEVVASHLLTLIGRSQRQDEKRLAALDVSHTNLTEPESKSPPLPAYL